ncbi:tRNA (cytosine(48)-C(5))-methyltransferase [Candidatus Tiddalikarchaeum anstoanum]|nr:tRNA (cytosine(48)-C(5))-methyltransferase [Candidatus Tiddalikarchaeum anstoanum]
MIKREFEKSYTERFGPNFVRELTEKICTHYNDYIRVNTLKISVADLKKRLENRGFRFKMFNNIPYALRVMEEPFSISSTPEYLLGYFYVQDGASMMPVIALDPKKEDLILDSCGAPGGKCSHISQLMNNDGVIVSLDIDRKRLKSQLFNLQRLGVKNVATFLLDAKQVRKIGILFDKVLVDPPCSASGVIWKEKKRLKSISKQQVEKYSKIQKDILTSSVKTLKHEGLIVYSTCSIEAEENEENVNFAEKELGLKCLKSEYFFPQVNNTHGFFYALMRKI